jgi:outer membrane protein OmpA-like peptidoglycan-associated protein
VGSPAYNQRLGLERAEAVKRYLYEQHSVPLHKINVISYGEEKPAAADNKTRENRAMNRRVVIKVLA